MFWKGPVESTTSSQMTRRKSKTPFSVDGLWANFDEQDEFTYLTFLFVTPRYAQLSDDELKYITDEVKGALIENKHGLGVDKRFAKNTPSDVEKFCRLVSGSSILRPLHLGQRTKPPYWPIKRAATNFVNNAIGLARQKEKRARKNHLSEVRGPQKGAEDADDADKTPLQGLKQLGRAAVRDKSSGTKATSTGDRSEQEKSETPATLSSGMLPLDAVVGFDFSKCSAGDYFVFLSEEQARLVGALESGLDCISTSETAYDALCEVTIQPERDVLHGHNRPSEEYVVVAFKKYNAKFGFDVKIPWQNLYPETSAMATKFADNGWKLKPGQMLWWRKDCVWILDDDKEFVGYKDPKETPPSRPLPNRSSGAEPAPKRHKRRAA